ncbi:hypothetical protein [Ascidiimonas sp. W6]|uniref:hypothetical protein n=1 Tax=Ascidiimonas meishanensis TaxID=3128903 RepID=UPI0030ECF0A4
MLKKILLCSFAFIAITIQAQTLTKRNPDAKLADLIDETQSEANEGDAIGIVWWIPTEFWELSFRDDSSMSDSEAQAMIDIIKEYTLVAVVKGKLGVFGGVTYESQQALENDIFITSIDGDIRKPLKESQVSPDLTNLLSMLKPVFSNMMGNFGENFHFFVFDSKNSSNKYMFHPLSEDDFTINLGKEDVFTYDLPLSSLIMPKICLEDNKQLNGKWNYCPIHGTTLKEQN